MGVPKKPSGDPTICKKKGMVVKVDMGVQECGSGRESVLCEGR